MSQHDPNYIQKKVKAPSAQGKSDLQRPAVNSTSDQAELASPDLGNVVPPVVNDALSSPGQPLDADIRAFMELHFGYDFSQVRVHTEEQAAESTRAVNALAYTVGKDVVFNTGQYIPGTTEGKRLLAHELTHVVQQEGEMTNASTPMKFGSSEDVYEQQASTIAASIAEGESPLSQVAVSDRGGGSLLQRQDADAGTTKSSSTPTSTWISDLITITLDSDQPNCLGITNPSSSSPYSDCLPDETIKAPFCHGVRVPFGVNFYIDRADAPRPQPFKAPTISVRFQFVTTKGNVLTDVQKVDASPRYVSPNIPLEPNFGHNFPISTDVSGTLFVHLELHDASGVNLVHDEAIHFIIEPCV